MNANKIYDVEKLFFSFSPHHGYGRVSDILTCFVKLSNNWDAVFVFLETVQEYSTIQYRVSDSL